MQRQSEHWLFKYPTLPENKKKENGRGGTVSVHLVPATMNFSRDEYWRAAGVTSANETSSTRVI